MELLTTLDAVNSEVDYVKSNWPTTCEEKLKTALPRMLKKSKQVGGSFHHIAIAMNIVKFAEGREWDRKRVYVSVNKKGNEAYYDISGGKWVLVGKTTQRQLNGYMKRCGLENLSERISFE